MNGTCPVLYPAVVFGVNVTTKVNIVGVLKEI
jgi:hypothetical protein